MSPDSDYMLDLISRYQSGDSAAAEELLSINAGAIGRQTRRYLPFGLWSAEDLLQEAAIVVLTSASRFRSDLGIPWINYLSQNIGRRLHYLLSKSKKTELPLEEWDPDLSYLSWLADISDPGSTQQGQHALTFADALELVSKLPEKPRLVYILRHNIDNEEAPGSKPRSVELVAKILGQDRNRVQLWLSLAEEQIQSMVRDMEQQRNGLLTRQVA